MLFRVGPGSSGYNWFPEYLDWDCVLTLTSGQTCVRGQVLCRNVSAVPSDTGADMVVLPNNAAAGPVYGVYQGPTLSVPATPAGVTQTFQIIVRVKGQGVVSAAASTVGGLLANSGALQPAVPADATEVEPGTFVGTSLATGTATAPGAAIPAGLQACAISV
jgi:hypothetical protein